MIVYESYVIEHLCNKDCTTLQHCTTETSKSLLMLFQMLQNAPQKPVVADDTHEHKQGTVPRTLDDLLWGRKWRAHLYRSEVIIALVYGDFRQRIRDRDGLRSVQTQVVVYLSVIHMPPPVVPLVAPPNSTATPSHTTPLPHPIAPPQTATPPLTLSHPHSPVPTHNATHIVTTCVLYHFTENVCHYSSKRIWYRPHRELLVTLKTRTYMATATSPVVSPNNIWPRSFRAAILNAFFTETTWKVWISGNHTNKSSCRMPLNTSVDTNNACNLINSMYHILPIEGTTCSKATTWGYVPGSR